MRGSYLVALLFVANASSAEMWKCTDADGNTRYSNSDAEAKGLKDCRALGLNPIDTPGLYKFERDWRDLGNALRAFKGKQISSAVTKLGYPAREQNIAGKTLVIWETAAALCRVTMEVDAASVVMGSQVEGNQEACNNWGRARKLIR